jgi:hypothetical protein
MLIGNRLANVPHYKAEVENEEVSQLWSGVRLLSIFHKKCSRYSSNRESHDEVIIPKTLIEFVEL